MTSPIYTVQTVLNPSDPHPVPVSAENMYGVISLIFWSVTVIVTVKYVLLVLLADNDGEGGIMALITLIRRLQVSGRGRVMVVIAGLGIFGASRRRTVSRSTISPTPTTTPSTSPLRMATWKTPTSGLPASVAVLGRHPAGAKAADIDVETTADEVEIPLRPSTTR